MALMSMIKGASGGDSSDNIVVEKTSNFGRNTPQNYHTDNGVFVLYHTPEGHLGEVYVIDGVMTKWAWDSTNASASYNSSTQTLSISQSYTGTAYIICAYNDLG